MLIEQPPQIFRLMTPGALFREKSDSEGMSGDSDKNIYLTFDDGPIPEITPWVLDILDRYRIKATFFMVGDNVRKYPEIYKEVIDRGHNIGNHTMHHVQGLKMGIEAYLEDVAEAARYIDSRLFRPPHGWLRPTQLMAIRQNYKVVMFDVVTRDYSKRVSASDVISNVKKYVRPGSVVVFHDSLKSWPRLEEALPASIEWMLREGYKFRLLDAEQTPTGALISSEIY